jgi:hypothetical protein
MDLQHGELCSCCKPRVTSTVDGNEVIGKEAERLLDVSEVVDKETTTIPAIKMERNVSCVCGDCYAHFL